MSEEISENILSFLFGTLEHDEIVNISGIFTRDKKLIL
jgi:hypothetical protein